jgi:hypothetical protein
MLKTARQNAVNCNWVCFDEEDDGNPYIGSFQIAMFIVQMHSTAPYQGFLHFVDMRHALWYVVDARVRNLSNCLKMFHLVPNRTIVTST